ncbi:MAG: cytochrome c oxidase subunit 3 [Saprospiraceae bacterium]|nr:cytochrome c oxidase subunit 3 [Saprospiraceae bacterium]
MDPSKAPQQDEFMFHPKNVQLFVLLAGLTFLFLALTVSYVYIRVTNGIAPVRLPALFLLNTLILLGSSYTLIQAKKSYLNDDTQRYQNFLKWTIWLSILFMIMQGAAWTWLFSQGVFMQSSTTTGFLYVISIVHFAHVVGGLPFLYLFYRTAKKRMVDPVTVLVYFSDPEKRLKLRLLTIYWHFLDILWIYLVVFFGVNQVM